MACDVPGYALIVFLFVQTGPVVALALPSSPWVQIYPAPFGIFRLPNSFRHCDHPLLQLYGKDGNAIRLRYVFLPMISIVKTVAYHIHTLCNTFLQNPMLRAITDHNILVTRNKSLFDG
jgi:hypothetical protein